MKSGIYQIINTVNGRTYIGSAVDLIRSNISKVCHGQRNHAGGFIWKYL